MDGINTLRIEQFKDFTVSYDFYANTLKNHLSSYHHYIEKPHRHAFTVVVYFTQGYGTHDIDFRQYQVKPGSLFILYPGQIHSWKLSEDTDGFIFFHSQLFFDERRLLYTELAKYRIQQAFFTSLFVDIDKKGTFWTLLEQLLKQYHKEEFGRNMYLMALITQIYLEILRPLVQKGTSMDKTQNTYQQHYRAFEDLLEKQFKSQKSVTYYAKELNITTKHLNRIVQYIVGKSATEVILERIILDAKRMLVNSQKNLNEIADDLGYEDYAYFSHLFKKKTGTAPSAFLKEINQ